MKLCRNALLASVLALPAPALADYCRRNVVGGPGAFILTTTGYASFADAIRRKLLREIAPGPTVARPDR